MSYLDICSSFIHCNVFFLTTECVDGQYGYNCQLLCNCLDEAEVCNKETGRCTSGCKHGYSGSSCQIGLSHFYGLHLLHLIVTCFLFISLLI